jgi:phosphate transport system substrate-binding protein
MQPKTLPDQHDRWMTARVRGRAYLGLLLAAAAACTAHAAAPILGAGATFPAPLYQAWALEYQRAAGISVRYEAVGSGLGVERITRRRVDFGGSDAALGVEQLEAAQLLQFPAVVGGVVPVINIRGIRPGELRLTGEVLAEIYSGQLRRWNDPAIAALNPTLQLPRANITVVHRQEPSGSSLLWTGYLSAGSAQWRAHIGASLSPAWPSGVGATGNEGVATVVQRTRFAIGYVEYYFARVHGLSDVALRNHDGNFVRARSDNFAAAAAASDWHELSSLQQLPMDAPGATSWPITGVSFILVPRSAPDAERERAVLRFFDWAIHGGGHLVEQLDYAPLPQKIIDQLPQLWQTVHDGADRPLWP